MYGVPKRDGTQSGPELLSLHAEMTNKRRRHEVFTFLGLSLAILPLSWACLGPVLGYLGTLWNHPMTNLGDLRPVLPHLASVLGLSWACLGPSWHPLEPLGRHLGWSWAYHWPSEPCHGPVLRPPGQEPDGLGHRHDHLRLLQTLKPSFALVKQRFWKSL